MNEFDRFVRHKLKPIAYVRYGDGFVLFCRSKTEAEILRKKATEQLTKELCLKVKENNDFIFKSKHALHFLGHRIYFTGFVMSNNSYQQALRNLNLTNATSYLGMNLCKKQMSKMPGWLL